MKAGIFSIGLDTYWDQFDGLRDNLLGSMAYYYEGVGEYENIVTSVIAGNTNSRYTYSLGPRAS